MSVIAIAILISMLVTIATNTASEEKISAYLDGDFIIGALFSVHYQPKQKQTGNLLSCGEIRELYGIQRVEVTFQTLDKINSDPTILPNITLGVEIRDSCWYAPVALQQSIEFIRDAISPVSHQTCDVANTNPMTQKPKGWSSVSEIGKLDSRWRPKRPPLVGVVGPGSSSVALQVQNLLQLFQIPQVGYSTTSRDLSDKSRFSYFLRVVPSDYYQAQVMVDIVRRFNWTYVSAVNTDENYGQSGIQAFRELAQKANVCIAKEDSVLSNAEDEVFDQVILNLNTDQNARVVVCFCEGLTVRGLLNATHRLNLTGRFLFLGSDGWATRTDVVKGLERVAKGSMSIQIYSPQVKPFDQYYFRLNPFNNSRNPWFKEFWQARFNCSIPGENDSTSTNRNCTGTERLNENYKQDPKLSFVVKAIYTLAHGLHNMHQSLCGPGYEGMCANLFPLNGSLLKTHLLNVSFEYGDGEKVEFDKRGDPPGRYNIMNFQELPNASYDYVLVGDWNNGTLTMNGPLQYPDENLESVCSRPCGLGYYKKLHTGGQEQQCCWVCVPCERNQILINETTCAACELGYWPNVNQSACDEIGVEVVQWSDTQALVSICFSCVGFLTTSLAGVVFMQYNNTPVVKSSTRELSYLILVGMFLSHSATFPIVARPSRLTCALSRLLPGISFAFIYASLLTKTNRIARILAGSKKKIITKKPKFMTATSQCVITTILITVEVCISVSMLMMEPPGPTKLFPSVNRAVLVCNTSAAGVIIPLAFDFLLISLCTLYAVKTRNVPENFNEAKFIGFAMYTTCVIWIAFGPIYFGSNMKVITLCLCVSFSAMVNLVFLFLPKIYIILFHPERNNRSHFTTSKDIRCFIGTRSSSNKNSSSSSYNNVKRDMQGYTPSYSGNWQSAINSARNFNNNTTNMHQQISNKISWRTDSNTSDSNIRSQQDVRSLSCQTSLELLHLLLDVQWEELTPRIFGARENAGGGGRVWIREESLSCGDGDEADSGQLKHITIKLASSTTSVASDWEHHF